MRNKNRRIFAILLSILMVCSNFAFIFAEDEVEVKEEPQVGQVEEKKSEPQVEKKIVEDKEVKVEKIEEPKVEEPKAEESKIEEKTNIEEPKITKQNTTEPEPETESTEEEQTPNEDKSVIIHYKNGLSTLNQYKNEDGVPQPYEKDMILVNGQTKTQTATGVLSNFGGKNYSFSYAGVTYTFLNVITEVDKNTTEPIYWNSATDNKTISKINNTNSNITYTYQNTTEDESKTKTINNRSDIYVAPVYKQTQNWFLNYNYIDNISTGSGSWSNLDAITQYKHTFSNPETKSPALTEGEYQFQYWKNENTEEKYSDGESFIYNGNVHHEDGYTEVINVYAYWQPAVKVYLHNGAEIIKTITSFDSINSADFEKLADTDIQKFLGWFDENDQLADIYNAPAITKEADSVLIIDLFAKFKEIIQPTDDPTDPVDPVDPTDNPKPQPKKTQPQVQPVPQVEEVVIASTNPPTTTINPASTPKAEPQGGWALINLIAAILSCICALVLLFVRKDTEDDEPTDDEKKDMRKMVLTKIASTIIGIGSIIIFILTEDMSLPMVLTDKWTFLMILLLIIEIVNIFMIRQQSKGEGNDDNN